MKISEFQKFRVFVPKKPKKGKDGQMEERWGKLGKVHMAVFTPDGSRIVGFTVKRPDIAGMVKRDDVFLGIDSWELDRTDEKGRSIRTTRGDDSLDDAARERLGVDWDACIIWEGMDAKTSDGRELGYVSDAEFDERTGAVEKFYVGDSSLAQALVGTVEVPPSMVVGYRKGFMILKPEAARIELNGGAAAKAGEGVAKMKVKGAELGEQAKQNAKETGEMAAKAVDKGSFELGRAIGRTQKAWREAKANADEASGHTMPQLPSQKVEGTVSEPKRTIGDGAKPAAGATYAPAGKKAATTKAAGSGTKAPAKKAQTKKAPAKASAKKQEDAGTQAAKAIGRGLGSMGKMFGGFKDEFDKASK